MHDIAQNCHILAGDSQVNISPLENNYGVGFPGVLCRFGLDQPTCGGGAASNSLGFISLKPFSFKANLALP